jgi:hypothetical protein
MTSTVYRTMAVCRRAWHWSRPKSSLLNSKHSSMASAPRRRGSTPDSSYAVGALAGGLVGVAYAMQVGGVLPNGFDFSKSITLLAMVVLGGMGNVWGVTLGALFLAWFNQTDLQEGGNAINNAAGANINGLTLHVMPGEIVTLIESNGAGKSTTLRTISGLPRPRRGSVVFNGMRLDKTPGRPGRTAGRGTVARGSADLPTHVGGGEPRPRRIPV